MKNLIRKILKENEDDFGWVSELNSELPFEISPTPTNKPKLSNIFRVNTTWEYNDLYVRDHFDFHVDDQKQFEKLINLCKLYIKYMRRQPETWRHVNDLAKEIGLSLSSYEEDGNYGTSKDMSDFVIGIDYPAYLHRVDISYYDKGGVEYGVRLKN